VGRCAWFVDRAKSRPSNELRRWTRQSGRGARTARKRRPCGPPELLELDNVVIGISEPIKPASTATLIVKDSEAAG